jgi:hypothetical protein
MTITCQVRCRLLWAKAHRNDKVVSWSNVYGTITAAPSIESLFTAAKASLA